MQQITLKIKSGHAINSFMISLHKQPSFLRKKKKLSFTVLFAVIGVLCVGISVAFWKTHTPRDIVPKKEPPKFLAIHESEQLPFDTLEEKEEEVLAVQSQEQSDLTEIFKMQEGQKQRPYGTYLYTPTWMKNCCSWKGKPTQNNISIIIDDVEFASSKEWNMIRKIRAPLTFVLSSYGQRTQNIIKKARKASREVLVYLPLAPHNKKIVRPSHISCWITPNTSNGKLTEMLNKKLKISSGIMGFTNYFPTQCWTQKNTLEKLFTHLRKKGAVFLDTPHAPSRIGKMARTFNVPYLKRDITLYPDTSSLEKSLKILDKKLKKQHYLIIAVKPYPALLRKLMVWMKKHEKDPKTSFVPLSIIFKKVQNNAQKPLIIAPEKIENYSVELQ